MLLHSSIHLYFLIFLHLYVPFSSSLSFQCFMLPFFSPPSSSLSRFPFVLPPFFIFLSFLLPPFVPSHPLLHLPLFVTLPRLPMPSFLLYFPLSSFPVWIFSLHFFCISKLVSFILSMNIFIFLFPLTRPSPIYFLFFLSLFLFYVCLVPLIICLPPSILHSPFFYCIIFLLFFLILPLWKTVSALSYFIPFHSDRRLTINQSIIRKTANVA